MPPPGPSRTSLANVFRRVRQFFAPGHPHADQSILAGNVTQWKADSMNGLWDAGAWQGADSAVRRRFSRAVLWLDQQLQGQDDPSRVIQTVRKLTSVDQLPNLDTLKAWLGPESAHYTTAQGYPLRFFVEPGSAEVLFHEAPAGTEAHSLGRVSRGPEAEIGRRAACVYGVDREEWRRERARWAE
ncbi:uncharacterized protein RHOBADRAFT_41396 [Rhodotorula graminis WP1]|uniref:Uncharacterized protein n=1 Tax=Rhodotorula graminis (strain WP1) TaxID=578459 RepID=A0A194S9Z2_RHOGW|nr:uncharacterized protein RHOBADRAFT_41396 [Rhodotorula graminis WP1]KPV77404.1 hypothetical protein RHOBADRAFT_41396 [Rhodotorula graminis WP1]